MKRREFFRVAAGTVGAGALAQTVSAANRGQPEHEQPREQQPTVVSSTEVFEASISELRDAMDRGELTASRITELYLDRIEKLDRAGPLLNSVIELNPDAVAIAERLDCQRAAGRLRGPLHGIPILVKDNIETADKMTTTAGSLALKGSIAKQDSGVAEKLRRAGAILLGKTNLSEWANFRSTHSTSGWSGRGGQTRNAHALDRNPCGSSSGSGVAASASLCAAAIGTETNGSIVCPASINGIVGIKPTLGMVSRAGIVPLAHSQDTAGPMARTVKDAALLLAAIAGPDPRDAVTQHEKSGLDVKELQFDPHSLDGKRIGVARNFCGFHDQVDRLMEEALEAIRQQGATLIDPVDLSDHGAGRSGFAVMLYEFKADLNRYLAGLSPELPVHSLAELIDFNRQHASDEMPYFAQELFEKAQEKGSLEDDEYKDALKKMREAYREKGIDAAMDKDQLDAIVAPTSGPAWMTDLICGDHGLGGSSTPAARAGYPSITVPMGYVFGLPVGISFIGRAFAEPQLIEMAYAVEQATRHRQPPQYLPSAQLGADARITSQFYSPHPALSPAVPAARGGGEGTKR